MMDNIGGWYRGCDIEGNDERLAQRRQAAAKIAMRGSIHRYARLTHTKYEGWTWWPYEEPLDQFGT